MSNPCRLDDTTQNKIAYAIGYENGRADENKRVVEILHNFYEVRNPEQNAFMERTMTKISSLGLNISKKN